MSKSIPNPDTIVPISIATTSWVPAPAALTGVTMTALAGNPNVTIAGLANRDLIKIGDYLWDNANSEAIEVVFVDTASGKVGLADTGFTSAQTAADVYVIRDRYYRAVQLRSDGADSEIAGGVLTEDEFYTRNEQGLKAFFVDSNSGTVTGHAIR
jgi:hypothetical protein